MRLSLCCAIVLPVVAAPVSARQSTLDSPTGERLAWRLDSGFRANHAAAPATVFRQVIGLPGATWLRVHFGEVELAPGSSITLRSALDGEIQVLDAGTLAAWSNSSAYFNGAAIEIALVSAPGAAADRVSVTAIDAGSDVQPVGGGGQCGICGSDDRQPSSQLWASRLLPAGCTASVFTQDSCMVTAGHCIAGGMVVEFNVPNSNGNCSLNHPPIADQFPILDVTFEDLNPGNDWAVMLAGDNNLGQRPFERYGVLRPLDFTPAVPGQPVSVFGYGVDLTCTRSQTQQTSGGQICAVLDNRYFYDVDVRGGNSGSALIRNNTIIGIVTHCPCCNIATRIDVEDFTYAREAMCPSIVVDLPFTDGAQGVLLSPFKWTPTPGAQGSTRGLDEPSGEWSINVDATAPGGDAAHTAMIDAAGVAGPILMQYWYQQTGNDDPPEAGDDLVVEFLDAGGTWIEVNRHFGSGPDMTVFQYTPLFLPQEAHHATLRVRFRAISTEDGSVDDWFVDDVCIGVPGMCPEPPPCPTDLDGDGAVGINDLLDLLAAWGPNPNHPADLDHDGQVGITDLLALLAAWGPC